MFSLNPTFEEIEVSAAPSLIEQARAGETRAFGELCRVYETRLLRHAMGLCGNVTLAEELAQDTMVEAWKALRRYNGRCQFFTWLCAILLNRYRNTLRQKRPVPLTALGGSDQTVYENHLAAMTDQADSPDQSAQLREQAELVRGCLAALPPKLEQVIYLRFYVDDSLEDIAGALGCPVGTVKSRLFKALERLRAAKALGAHRENLTTKGGNL